MAFMQGKKAFWGILCWANALLCALLYAIKGDYSAVVVSFEFAFFATLCIIFLSFSSYKKSIFKKANAERTGAQKVRQNFAQIHAPNGDENSKNTQIQGLAHTQNQTAQIQELADTQTHARNLAQNTEFCVQTQGQIHAHTPKICLKKNAPQKILKFKAANDEFKPTLKLAFKNFGVFFSLAKLGAYAFLALGFLALQKQDLLDIAAFLSGISAVLLGVFAFAGFCAYKQKREI